MDEMKYDMCGAANVARNVAALGAKTTILGVIGDDESGRRVTDLLGSSGVDKVPESGFNHAVYLCEITIEKNKAKDGIDN